jgi:hypothetical protein
VRRSAYLPRVGRSLARRKRQELSDEELHRTAVAVLGCGFAFILKTFSEGNDCFAMHDKVKSNV